MTSPISPVPASPSSHRQAPAPRFTTPARVWTVVARREVMVKLRDKAFLVSTAATLVLIVGVALASILLGNRGTKATVAVVDTQGSAIVAATDQAMKASNEKSVISSVQVSDRAAGEAALQNGEAKALLVKQDGVWTLVFKKDVDASLSSAVTQAVQSQVLAQTAAKAGLTPGQLQTQSTVSTAVLNGDKNDALVGMIVGYAFALLFFMSSMTFGMQIAQSVAEEKSSRVVEILAAAVPIRALLAGKVLGNTILAFGQMALMGIAGLIAVSFTPYKSMLPALSGSIVWFLLFFIAGFLALACIWAVAGSLASRQEDLASTTTPLTMALALVYVVGFTATGTLKEVLSYVPVMSSVLMPGRLADHSAHWWDMVIALVLNLAFAAVTVIVGEKIYRRALLQNSGKISYKDALKLTD